MNYYTEFARVPCKTKGSKEKQNSEGEGRYTALVIFANNGPPHSPSLGSQCGLDIPLSAASSEQRRKRRYFSRGKCQPYGTKPETYGLLTFAVRRKWQDSNVEKGMITAHSDIPRIECGGRFARKPHTLADLISQAHRDYPLRDSIGPKAWLCSICDGHQQTISQNHTTLDTAIV